MNNNMPQILKSWLKTLTLLFWAFTAQAQQEYASIDAFARTIQKKDYPSPELLAQALCKNIKSEEEKARVIFTWLAENIRYDLDGVGKEGPEADSQQEYNEKRVKSAFKKQRGVCMDYALLYQKMAESVGLECAFISGNSKGSLLGGLGNHAWNAVKIKGKWNLLDATWGAGQIVNNKQFRKVFQPGYFFTSPRIFALDHFPEEEKWQFLDAPLSKDNFKKQANFTYGDPAKDLLDTEPFGAPLSKDKQGKITLRLKMKAPLSVFELVMNGRALKYERSEKDGWIILQFKPNNGRELQLWGGTESKNEVRTTLLGVFPLL